MPILQIAMVVVCERHMLGLTNSSLSLSLSHVCSFLLHYLCLQVVEDGYEFFARRQLVTLFSAPNYCDEYDNAGGMMKVGVDLMCSFQAS